MIHLVIHAYFDPANMMTWSKNKTSWFGETFHDAFTKYISHILLAIDILEANLWIFDEGLKWFSQANRFLQANRLSSTGLDMDLRHVTDFCIKFPIYQRCLNSKCHWTNNDRKILTCQFVVDSRTLPSVWGPNWIITHCTSHLIQ